MKLYNTVKELVRNKKRLELVQKQTNFKVEPLYFYSQEHLEKHMFADWQGMYPQIMQFAGRFMLEAQRNKIPLFVARAYGPHNQFQYGNKITISHSKLANRLTPDERALIKRIGMEVVERHRFNVVPLGSLYWKSADPDLLTKTNPHYKRQLTPHALVQQTTQPTLQDYVASDPVEPERRNERS